MKYTFAPETRPLSGYTIKRAIHRGGFGEVYYALSDGGKEVALKLLNNNLEVELRGVSQCLNLKHSNLVTIFDIRQDEDKDHWIVMEYVGGRGLHDVLQTSPDGLPVKEVLFWLSGISSGLAFLHDRGIVHRDLKPANIFREDDCVKIGDVGLSKFISESRRSSHTQSVGTVYYMAPEVARGRYGKEVDVYALGVILVEMLTGHVPFDGETTAEILMKHLTSDPDLTGVPESLKPVILQALEKDPEKRITDVTVLERLFREAASGNFTAATRTTTATLEAASPPLAPHTNPPSALNPSPDPAVAASVTSPAGSSVGNTSTESDNTASDFRLLSPSSWVTYWNEKLPAPARWAVMGAVLVMVVRQNPVLFRLIVLGAFLGVCAWAVRGLFLRIFAHGSHRHSQQRDVRSSHHMNDLPTSPGDRNGGAGYTGPREKGPVQAVVAPAVRTMGLIPQQSVPVRAYSPATRRQIPISQRISDLGSSLTMAMLAVVLVTGAIHLATEQLPNRAHIVYFGTTTLIASWCLILPSKLWEGRVGDTTLRRLLLGLLGLLTGAVSDQLYRFLLFSSSDELFQVGQDGFRETSFVFGQLRVVSAQGHPTTTGFLLFFGTLFLLRRWWWQVDSFRKSRLRISSALWTLVIGAFIAALIPFPVALGTTWALAISVVVQLCSGWTPPEERRLVAAPNMTNAGPMTAEVKPPVLASRGRYHVAP
jgi:serine/threonine protein kinase